MSAQEALHKLEALPDIRKEAERLNVCFKEFIFLIPIKVRDEDLTRKISKLKAEYMQKKLNFIVTDPQQYKGTCKVCNQEVTAVEYELFKEGVKLNITLDGTLSSSIYLISFSIIYSSSQRSRREFLARSD